MIRSLRFRHDACRAAVFELSAPRAVRALIALATIVVVTAAPAALAYRPPARTLLQKAMERQIERGTKSVKVDAETQLFDVGGGSRGAAFVERLMFMGPGSARRESDMPEGTRVEVRVDERQAVRAAGAAAADKVTKAPIDILVDHVTTAPPLDDERATERLMRDLKALGVNTEVVTFARFDGRVSYLIGSKPWEKDKPQIWLDKETLLPTRVVMISKADDGKVRKTDVRYLGWGSPIGGNWFPASIEVYDNDKLVRRTQVKNVERNQPFDATLFALK